MSDLKRIFVRSAVVFLMAVSPMLTTGFALRAQESNDTTEIVIDGTMHEPSEIIRLVERSIMMYRIHSGDDSAADLYEPNKTVLTPGIHLSLDSLGIPQYKYFDLATTLTDQFKRAEKAFKDEDYRFAIDSYLELLSKQPSFDYLLAYIGDCFTELEEFDSASVYYLQAIENNSIDYQRRWFYADLLWKMGDSAKAINQLTIAHILNVHHERVLNRLVDMRGKVARPWKEWSILPKAHIVSEDGHNVEVTCDPMWAGYALAKALWLFEPDYALRMYGHPREQELIPIKEEREALVAAMSSNKELYSLVIDTIGVENLNLFILYEIIAKRNPYMMLLLAPESMEDLVEYLDKFH